MVTAAHEMEILGDVAAVLDGALGRRRRAASMLRRYGILHRPVPEFGRLQVVPRLHLDMVGRPVDEAGDGVRRRGDF